MDGRKRYLRDADRLPAMVAIRCDGFLSKKELFFHGVYITIYHR